MTVITPQNKPPGGLVLPSQNPITPQKATKHGHIWSNAFKAIKEGRIFGGDKWSELPQREKDYLYVAALILGFVLMLFSLLTFIFGFGAMAPLIPKIATLLSSGGYPLLCFARSQIKRRDSSTPQDIAAEERRKAQLLERRNKFYTQAA